MKKKDWTGNQHSIFVTLGSSNHVEEDRALYDFYATDPKALELLISDGGATFSHKILEPCAGDGHLAEVLKSHGYEVVCADIIQRNYPLDGTWDFLEQNKKWKGDIVINPPYSQAQQFIEKSLEMIRDDDNVYAFLKLQFLEGKARRKLFDTKQLKEVFVSSSRLACAKNGNFDMVSGSAVAFAWFHWQKGFCGDPIIKWIN